ncbi:putative voltage-gated ClC-type chloride channel ClcB [Planctomycetes bacterium CA13]|uniref:Putative voltage-gated ClC-type chloride channel ClcB n=1 Tax=Novipirellula herctigrandis TaxID=2527986 RepID=A0A5C5Z1R5_9BACT|nr:putative voltage-gated ClC-type chloride channel ClcB [Planctomycetes bacterium CA13]
MFDVKTAADFMRKKLTTLAPETDVLEGVSSLLKDNISGAPVVDTDGNYLGVFSEKCCMNALTASVEAANEAGLHLSRVREFMTHKLITLTPDVDVFEAIDDILKRHISGAPVVDDKGRFLGIFSEKTAMRVLIAALHDNLPGTHVKSYMNTDSERIIHEEDTLLDVAHRFQETPYRRLPALKGGKLVGQVSRRDVLRAEHRIAIDVATAAKRDDASGSLKEAAEQKLVGPFMDRDALTTVPSTDMLSIAQMFLSSPYRRLPVVEQGRLVGQVSRRDLLEAAAQVLRPKPQRRGAETLYLSGVAASAPPSLG